MVFHFQKEYDSERISWKFMDYTDNQPCLDVLEGQPSVFGLLNEVSIVDRLLSEECYYFSHTNTYKT